MISRTITLPELGLIAGTRAALGAGIGLLLADRLDNDQRRAVGWTLFAVGAITTVPLLAEVMSRRESSDQGQDGNRRMRNTAEAAERDREPVLPGL